MDQTENFLIVTSSPHIKSNVTTQRIMLDVIIALCPALAASVWIFGPRAARYRRQRPVLRVL